MCVTEVFRSDVCESAFSVQPPKWNATSSLGIGCTQDVQGGLTVWFFFFWCVCFGGGGGFMLPLCVVFYFTFMLTHCYRNGCASLSCRWVGFLTSTSCFWMFERCRTVVRSAFLSQRGLLTPQSMRGRNSCVFLSLSGHDAFPGPLAQPSQV